jgi:hypothetical protein
MNTLIERIMAGHFFCPHCNDVVFPPSFTPRQSGGRCPQCHRGGMDFVPHAQACHRRPRYVTRERAKVLFNQIRQGILETEEVD